MKVNNMTQTNEKNEKNTPKKQIIHDAKDSKPKHTRKRQTGKKPNRKNEKGKEKDTKNDATKLDKTIEETIIPEKDLIVQKIDPTTITINGEKYEITKDYREAFDARRLSERYSPILDKYDYIVGDWGFEQLRLKGFYSNQNRKVPQDKKISQLEDYLYEYCNFGAPYFVIQRLEPAKSQSSSSKNTRHKKQKKKNVTNVKNTHTQEFPNAPGKNVSGAKRTNKNTRKRNFVKKEVPAETKTISSETESVLVKTVKDEKGSRRFNIRRGDVDRAKNKS